MQVRIRRYAFEDAANYRTMLGNGSESHTSRRSANHNPKCPLRQKKRHASETSPASAQHPQAVLVLNMVLPF